MSVIALALQVRLLCKGSAFADYTFAPFLKKLSPAIPDYHSIAH